MEALYDLYLKLNDYLGTYATPRSPEVRQASAEVLCELSRHQALQDMLLDKHLLTWLRQHTTYDISFMSRMSYL